MDKETLRQHTCGDLTFNQMFYCANGFRLVIRRRTLPGR